MNRYKSIETQIKHLQTIEESGQINQYAQGKLNALLEVMALVKGDEVLDFVSKSLPTKEEVIAEGDKQIDDWLSENHHKEQRAYRVAFRRSFEYVLRKINVC